MSDTPALFARVRASSDTRVFFALQNFQIVGVCLGREYEGAESPWPHGFAHLNGDFTLIDDRIPEEMAKEYRDHFRPQNAVDTLRCPNCGCTEFVGTQSIKGCVSVVVSVTSDGKAMFIGNATDDGEIDTSGLDCDDPEGPFVCNKCGQTLEIP